MSFKIVTVNDVPIHWRSTSTPNQGGYADYRYRPPGPIEASFWHEPLKTHCWLRRPDLEIIQLDLNADIERCDEHGDPLPAPATASGDFGLDLFAELERQTDRQLDDHYKRLAEYDELAASAAKQIARMLFLERRNSYLLNTLGRSRRIDYCGPTCVQVDFASHTDAASFRNLCRQVADRRKQGKE